MPQVDFYILAENSSRDINRVCCQLCEKALTQKMKVLIYTQSIEQAEKLDDLLWSFKANSFIPHYNQLTEPNDASQSQFDYPVLISSNDTLNEHYSQLLINLSNTVPPFYQQFSRIAEMIDNNSINNSNARESARERYRFYQKNNYPLNKYDL